MPAGRRDDELAQALGRLRVSLDRAYERACRAVGLSPQQAELLCASMRPSAVKDLAETLGCDRSNVTRLVDRAVASGRARRRTGERDGRVTVVELTASGERLARHFLNELASQSAELGARWPRRRSQEVTRTLNEIAAALDARPLPARLPPEDAP